MGYANTCIQLLSLFLKYWYLEFQIFLLLLEQTCQKPGRHETLPGSLRSGVLALYWQSISTGHVVAVRPHRLLRRK